MDGRLRHSAGFLAGGGDTPSPTPKRFKYRENGSKLLLCTEEGKVVYILQDENRKAFERAQHPTIGRYYPTSEWESTEDVQAQGEIVMNRSINISLDGYESLAMTWDNDSSYYIPTTYEPEALT